MVIAVVLLLHVLAHPAIHIELPAYAGVTAVHSLPDGDSGHGGADSPAPCLACRTWASGALTHSPVGLALPTRETAPTPTVVALHPLPFYLTPLPGRSPPSR